MNIDNAKKLLQESNVELAHMGAKGSVGIMGSFAAMSINDWAGFIVAVLTGIYMLLQIEAALKKRKQAKDTQSKKAET